MHRTTSAPRPVCSVPPLFGCVALAAFPHFLMMTESENALACAVQIMVLLALCGSWTCLRACAVQILDLPSSLLSSNFCRPLLLRAHECMLACFADLEAAWADPVGVICVAHVLHLTWCI